MADRMKAKTIEVKASHLSLISHPNEIHQSDLERCWVAADGRHQSKPLSRERCWMKIAPPQTMIRMCPHQFEDCIKYY